jgi:hypothetical protein
MNQTCKITVVVLCLLLTAGLRLQAGSDEEKWVILKARYTAVEGTNVEYGQGAIERNELEHREIAPSVWLIRVAVPADAAGWQRKLNASVDSKHGRFEVGQPTPDELRRVELGEITFQK